MVDAEKPVAEGLRGELRQREPMARHTSWRAGGAADQAYFPADLADLAAFLRALPASEPVQMVGLGSNLLVRDRGLRGTVIFTHWALRAIRVGRVESGHGEIYAEAGIASPRIARFAAMHGFKGAEFLAGIPGTVGGALAMNAGAFGGETWKIVDRAVTIDRSGTLRERWPADYEIDYRHARLVLHSSEEWFVAATFRLPRGDRQSSRRIIKGLLQQRLATQPLERPNAGSVFRNPSGSEYAAHFIEACGLKGHEIGGAQISTKHANFIVNAGGASAADIEALIDLAERSVSEKFGITLVREVRIVGERW
ncbi:MAG: UDP-N-acetylmuramate dehydrogenase [Betaproteobacteria bacterium]|nr:UDP-N-acetylmuramate dehydrogenase [Betaproteobacteria bacterium]MDH3437638.1 UDP-N-acetylmuramate dehydrogenase [Betaproteobacteria bacterium]